METGLIQDARYALRQLRKTPGFGYRPIIARRDGEHAAARWITFPNESQLYDAKGVDSGVLVTSIVTLTVAAAIAGLIPARALRNE